MRLMAVTMVLAGLLSKRLVQSVGNVFEIKSALVKDRPYLAFCAAFRYTHKHTSSLAQAGQRFARIVTILLHHSATGYRSLVARRCASALLVAL